MVMMTRTQGNIHDWSPSRLVPTRTTMSTTTAQLPANADGEEPAKGHYAVATPPRPSRLLEAQLLEDPGALPRPSARPSPMSPPSPFERFAAGEIGRMGETFKRRHERLEGRYDSEQHAKRLMQQHLNQPRPPPPPPRVSSSDGWQSNWQLQQREDRESIWRMNDYIIRVESEANMKFEQLQGIIMKLGKQLDEQDFNKNPCEYDKTKNVVEGELDAKWQADGFDNIMINADVKLDILESRVNDMVDRINVAAESDASIWNVLEDHLPWRSKIDHILEDLKVHRSIEGRTLEQATQHLQEQINATNSWARMSGDVGQPEPRVPWVSRLTSLLAKF